MNNNDERDYEEAANRRELMTEDTPDPADAPTVTTYRTVHTPADAEDATSVDEVTVDCTPDPDDIEEGYDTPAKIAARVIRDANYMSGPECASGISPNGNGGYAWPGPGTWFSAEPYEHPYHNEREETSAHLTGAWTDEQREEVWRMVTAK